jgi:hypothetical protein
MSTDKKTTLRQEFEKHRDELRQMADEIRVKLNLAGKEAKQAWQQIEPQLADFERKVDEVTSELAADFKRAGGELRKQLTKLRDRLR